MTKWKPENSVAMNVIHKVIIGSQLHGLASETSDIDLRGIHISPLKDFLSPYKKLKNTSWIEWDQDDTSYELTEFCKLATQWNPNILEILWSDKVEDTSFVWAILKDNRDKFLDSTRIYEAFRGYAKNQYNKMNLFTPDQRTPKFAVAYLRTMYQWEQLLRTGTFDTEMKGKFKEFLLKVKFDFDNVDKWVLAKEFERLNLKLTETYYKHWEKFKPDLEWIENFILRAYTNDYETEGDPLLKG